VEDGVGGEFEELLVVIDVFPVVEVRFPPDDKSPLIGVDGGGGNTLQF
jgi:hypothetical protein